jgi:hypothetical protein
MIFLALFFKVIFHFSELIHQSDFWELREFTSGTYARFYAVMLLCIFFLTSAAPWAVQALVFVVGCSFWVPQIVLCAVDDVRPPLSPRYVVAVSCVFSRLLCCLLLI